MKSVEIKEDSKVSDRGFYEIIRVMKSVARVTQFPHGSGSYNTCWGYPKQVMRYLILEIIMILILILSKNFS